MDDVSDEAGASLSQSFGMDKADIFFGRTLKLTLGWKIRSHRSENGKKIMGEDPQSLENHGFPQISQLVLHSIKSLEIKRFQGFFLFSNRKGSDRTAKSLCTKFGRFGGQNLVQNRWGMCRSSPLPCPSVDLKPPAAFCTENRVRQAVSFSFCLTHTGFESTCPIILANPWRKIYFFRNYRILLHLHRPSNDTRFVRYPRLPV